MNNCSDDVKEQQVDANCGSKLCNCSRVLREVAGENLQLRKLVEDQRELILKLKHGEKKDKEELRKKDKQALVYVVVCVVSIVFGLSGMFVRLAMV